MVDRGSGGRGEGHRWDGPLGNNVQDGVGATYTNLLLAEKEPPGEKAATIHRLLRRECRE